MLFTSLKYKQEDFREQAPYNSFIFTKSCLSDHELYVYVCVGPLAVNPPKINWRVKENKLKCFMDLNIEHLALGVNPMT
jgi:hypothetical protein